MIRIDTLWLCTHPQNMRAGADRLLNFVEQFHKEHAERYLLAFVYGWLAEHDLKGVRTEAEKYLMLGALKLVECVAFVGADKPRR